MPSAGRGRAASGSGAGEAASEVGCVPAPAVASEAEVGFTTPRTGSNAADGPFDELLTSRALVGRGAYGEVQTLPDHACPPPPISTPGASYEEDDEDDEEEGVESREMISFSAFRSRVCVTESPEPMAPTAHAFAHGCETDSPQPPPVGPDAAPVHHTAPPPSNKAAERTANAAAWQRAVAKGSE